MVCGMIWEIREMLADFWWGYLKEKDYLEPLGIKLKWILKKQDGIILWFYNILIVKPWPIF